MDAVDSYLQRHTYTLTSKATPTTELADGDPILLAEVDTILLYLHRQPYAETARMAPYATLLWLAA